MAESEESEAAPAIWRPYFFEVFTLANFIVIQAVLWRTTRAPLTTLLHVFIVFVPAFAGQAAAGIAIRAAIAWRRKQLAGFLAAIRSPLWIVDTVRIVIFSAFMVQTYCWIKLAIPLLHPQLFDQQLWDIDSALFFGYSPNLFLLELFSNPAVLRFVDWSYANVFYASLVVGGVYFASSPSRRVRLAFTDSNIAMWLIGAWLYVLIPSLGPAYRFPDIWLPLAASFQETQQMQHTLMSNYNRVLGYRDGVVTAVNILFGIAAFPSLHVAFEALALFWMRRLWRYGEVIFGVFTLVIFIGSIVTGWHYLIDGVAGVVLAWVCYRFALWQYKIPRGRFFESHAPADTESDHAR